MAGAARAVEHDAPTVDNRRDMRPPELADRLDHHDRDRHVAVMNVVIEIGLERGQLDRLGVVLPEARDQLQRDVDTVELGHGTRP